MTSNGTLQDGCDERHDVRFRKRWRCLLRVNRIILTVGRPIPVYPINRHRRPPGISDWCRASAAVELRVIEPRGRRRGDRAIRDFGASASFLHRRRSTWRLESIPTDRQEIDRAVRGRQIDGLFLSGLTAALGYSQCSIPSAAITLRAISTTLLNSVSWPSNCMWQRLLKPKSHMVF
jgi:hypothetical protein